MVTVDDVVCVDAVQMVVGNLDSDTVVVVVDKVMVVVDKVVVDKVGEVGMMVVVLIVVGKDVVDLDRLC